MDINSETHPYTKLLLAIVKVRSICMENMGEELGSWHVNQSLATADKTVLRLQEVSKNEPEVFKDSKGKIQDSLFNYCRLRHPDICFIYANMWDEEL